MRSFASCGDWLAHPVQSPSTGDRTADDAPMFAHVGGWVDASSASNHEPSRLPCDGPFCRNAPSKPVPTAPPSTVNPSNKLLLTAQGIVCAPANGWSFMSNEFSADAFRGFPLDIEHPPRA